MDETLIIQIVFYLFAAITVGSAFVVVFARNLIRSAFALLFTFGGVAALYAFIGADFLAATQMVIYVGGILVLLLFGLMLTHKLYDLNLRSETHQVLPGLVAAIAVFAILTTFLIRAHWYNGGPSGDSPTTSAIGELFMKDYLLPFEVASILLLIALIGAVMLVRRRPE
jgi:NADH-quinone oxidoreductase subunit J